MPAIDGGVRITGLTECIRKLQGMGVEVADLKDAFGSLAAHAAALAASFAPKDSGRLAASIRGNRAKNSATVRAGGKRVPYAAAINYGWPRRNITGSGFMQRADAAIRPTVVPTIEKAISRLIAEKGMQ